MFDARFLTPIVAVLDQYTHGLFRRSQRLVIWMERNLSTLVGAWLVLAGLACLVRIAFPARPTADMLEKLTLIFPYVLVVATPALAIVATAQAFPSGMIHAQPQIRLARVGRWHAVNGLDARSHPGFGSAGLMASLLLGILMNIPVRTAEFLVAIPAVGTADPVWLRVLFSAMFTDVAVMCSLYAAAFVLALRHVPWFPRFLALVWCTDLLMQFSIANVTAATPGLPGDVAAALNTLLVGNLKKALISITLWLPYLLVSDRVNLTFRSRVRARVLARASSAIA